MNICLVGCGGMASCYLHRYTQITGARLDLVIDASENIARKTAQKFGVKRWSTDFNEALAPGIDITDISTPNYLHKEQAVAALEVGKHVLLQKPIATTVEEAKAIVEAGYRSGRQVGMYMSMFDNPVFYEVKKVLEQGLLGKVSGIYCRGAHRGGINMPENNWRKSVKLTGGGSFIQLAIHPINMMQFLINDRIIQVSAYSKNMMCPNIGGDDVASVACEFESGILGTIESAYCADMNALNLYGSKGYIGIFNDSQILIMLDDVFDGDIIKYYKPGKPEYIQTGIDPDMLFETDNPYDQHIAFVEAVKTGKIVTIPAEIGLLDLKVVNAVYRSAEERRSVNLDEL